MVYNHSWTYLNTYTHTHTDCGKLKIHIIIPGTTPKNAKTYSYKAYRGTTIKPSKISY